MRQILDHIVRSSPFELLLSAADERGPGNANHEYIIHYPVPGPQPGSITFQNGPILEVGVNGLTNEVLLAIVIDRLRGFQAGDFACRENALALTQIETGLHWLQQRTIDRLRRGVEGMSRP